ncbi:MAG: bifunctional oligoribonuclease/PAP phosphatase NrnA [Gemmataceae bacterium]|nr:bifunctional oligoribonuclease/PAP phosphatase NrnA [Gemmataceae bacterium]
MPIDWTPFVELVRRSQRFLLTTHVRPDPDGLGSQLGLADALEGMGKQVRMVIASAWPPRYDFLDPDKRIQRFQPPGNQYRDVDAVVILDTATWNQLGDFGPFLKTLTCAKAVIDHHLSWDDLSALRFVDTASESTGRLVYEAIQALDGPLSTKAANFLFAAMATDTGWFRHQNTVPATFALAEKLVAAGAKPTWLYEQIYERNPPAKLKLMGTVLLRLRVVEDGKVALSDIRVEDYAATGAIPQDSEDLVNYCRSVDGVDVGLLFMEQPAGGVKVSFRSRENVDVAKIAEQFGGGGHRLASGATLQTTLADAERRVLAAVGAALG